MHKTILATLTTCTALLVSPVFGQFVHAIISHATITTPSQANSHSATIDSTATVDPCATVDATATTTGGATVNAGATQDAGATIEASVGFNIWSPAPLPSSSHSAISTSIKPSRH